MNAMGWRFGALILVAFAQPATAQQPTSSPDVAAEIMQLRQELAAEEQASPSPVAPTDDELAGAIRQLADGPPAPTEPPTPPQPLACPQHGGDAIRLLRDTAFQLDTLAHQLELSDLCRQADELRAVASRLREDARRRRVGRRPKRPAELGPPGRPSVTSRRGHRGRRHPSYQSPLSDRQDASRRQKRGGTSESGSKSPPTP
ncbi:MAG: hypothetical protein AAGF31_08110 [Planctomycetota bacterium]